MSPGCQLNYWGTGYAKRASLNRLSRRAVQLDLTIGELGLRISVMHQISFVIALLLTLVGLVSSIMGLSDGRAYALGVGLLLMFGGLIFAVLTFAVKPAPERPESKRERTTEREKSVSA